MKAQTILLVLALMLGASTVQADAISEHLERALALHKEGKFLQAQAEIEKALELIEPKAKAQIPPAEVTDCTYTNYEYAFRVTRPETDWKFTLLKTKTPGSGATYPLCQIAYVKEGAAGDDMVICYVRDLKAFLGSRYEDLKGKEMDFVKGAGRQMASSIRQLEDVQITGQTVVKVSGLDAVRTDYRARKGVKSMRCFTVHVLRDHLMFTAMFVGSMKNEADVAPAFQKILDSIDLSPIEIPAK